MIAQVESIIRSIQFSQNPCANRAMDSLRELGLVESEYGWIYDRIRHEVALQKRRIEQVKYLAGASRYRTIAMLGILVSDDIAIVNT